MDQQYYCHCGERETGCGSLSTSKQASKQAVSHEIGRRGNARAVPQRAPRTRERCRAIPIHIANSATCKMACRSFPCHLLLASCDSGADADTDAGHADSLIPRGRALMPCGNVDEPAVLPAVGACEHETQTRGNVATLTLARLHKGRTACRAEWKTRTCPVEGGQQGRYAS